MVNNINANPETNLIGIFRRQMNVDFPIDIEKDMKPTFIGFKRLDTFVFPGTTSSTDYYKSTEEPLSWLYSFFGLYEEVDEPIKRAIKNIIDNDSPDGYFFLNHGAGEYALFQSSLTKKTSDISRYQYDLVQISTIRDILAVADYCSWNCGKQHTPFAHFLPIRRKSNNSRNLDLGYCYLFDENGDKALYDVWIEFFSDSRRHMHCVKVPRSYKPKRHFLVKLRE